MTPLQEKLEIALEEFDEKFGKFSAIKNEGNELVSITDGKIKSFLTSYHQDLIGAVRELIEGKVRPDKSEEQPPFVTKEMEQYVEGYRTACDDILQELEK